MGWKRLAFVLFYKALVLNAEKIAESQKNAEVSPRTIGFSDLFYYNLYRYLTGTKEYTGERYTMIILPVLRQRHQKQL